MKKILVLALSLGVIACSQHSEPSDKFNGKVIGVTAQAENYQHLNNYTWHLISAMDKKNKRIDDLFVRPDMPIALQFNDQQISILNLCNNTGGGFALKGNYLTVSNLASNAMACEAPLDNLDSSISKLLQGTSTIKISKIKPEPQLTVKTANGDTLIFKATKTPEFKYGSKAETIFLEIAPTTKPCTAGAGKMQCLQVKEVKYNEQGLKTYTGSQWQNFYDNIDGFKHNTNQQVIVRVNRYKVSNPPADASSYAYVLDTVIQQSNVKK